MSIRQSSCFPCYPTVQIYEDISHTNRRPQQCIQVTSRLSIKGKGKENINKRNLKITTQANSKKDNNNVYNHNQNRNEKKQHIIVEDIPIEKIIYRRDTPQTMRLHEVQPRQDAELRAVQVTYSPIIVERIINAPATQNTVKQTFIPLLTQLAQPQPTTQPSLHKNDAATQPNSIYDQSSLPQYSQSRPSLPNKQQQSSFRNPFTNHNRQSYSSAPISCSPSPLINLSPIQQRSPQSSSKLNRQSLSRKQHPNIYYSKKKYQQQQYLNQMNNSSMEESITPIMQSTEENRPSSLYQGGKTIISKLKTPESDVVYRYARGMQEWKIQNLREFNKEEGEREGKNQNQRQNQKQKQRQIYSQSQRERQDRQFTEMERQQEGRREGENDVNQEELVLGDGEEEKELELEQQPHFTLVSIDAPLTPRMTPRHQNFKTSTTLIASLLPQPQSTTTTDPNTPSLAVGQLIGVGRYSQVYLCRQTLSGAIFAMKQIFKKTVIVHKMQDKIIQYIQGINTNSIQSIVEVYGVFQTEDRLCILMQFCQGTLFQQLLQRKLSIQQCTQYLKQLLNALLTLHSENIPHGNVSLLHVMVNLSSLKLKFISINPIQVDTGDTTVDDRMRHDIVDAGIIGWRMLEGLQMNDQKIYQRQKRERDPMWRMRESQIITSEIHNRLQTDLTGQERSYLQFVLMLLQSTIPIPFTSHHYLTLPLFNTATPPLS